MSRGHGSLQRSLLALIEANPPHIDTFALTALAFAVKPDAQGNVAVNGAQLASARRALSALARERKIIGSTARLRGGRRAWALPDHAGRPGFD
jgi:hypothetical protein